MLANDRPALAGDFNFLVPLRKENVSEGDKVFVDEFAHDLDLHEQVDLFFAGIQVDVLDRRLLPGLHVRSLKGKWK